MNLILMQREGGGRERKVEQKLIEIHFEGVI